MLAGGGGGGRDGDPTIEVQQDTVFVQGLPESVTEDQLASHFGSIGIIKVCTAAFM